jgi:hypothetical protein
LTAENQIHLSLLLSLGALSVAVFSHAPHSGVEGRVATSDAAPQTEPPREVNAGEISGAIDVLEGWIARARPRTATLTAPELSLSDLGPTADDRAHPERWLARLLGPEGVTALASDVPHSPALVAVDARLVRALAILLEAGIPLEQQLPLDPGASAAPVTLAELTQRALGAAPPRHAIQPDPWQLDLLAFAVLGGLTQYQRPLEEWTLASLRALDQQDRELAARPGSGELGRAELEKLAQDWQDPGHSPEGNDASLRGARRAAWTLHTSAAVFRATAVLADPELEMQARRQLSVLLFRYPTDRALYAYRTQKAHGRAEQSRVRLEALENLGRLEEALYSAQLGLRSLDPAQAAPRTTLVMRLAAHDLIEQLRGLDASAFEDQAPEPRAALLRAAVHALRGLRTARAAG